MSWQKWPASARKGDFPRTKSPSPLCCCGRCTRRKIFIGKFIAIHREWNIYTEGDVGKRGGGGAVRVCAALSGRAVVHPMQFISTRF